MNKFLKLFGLGILCTSFLVGCGGNEEPAKPSGPIDNSVRAENHDKLYIWRSKYLVANSGEKSPYPYVFLTPYLAPQPTGGAVIVCPGGAYTHLSNSTNDGWKQKCTNNDGETREGSDIAKFYNARGISVFVLNYRTQGLYTETNADLKLDGEFCYKQILSDGLRAVKYVRNLAINKYNEYYINKDKIGILGYSAGGNLAAEVLTQKDFDYASYDANYVEDSIDRLSAETNAGILGYAVSDFLKNAHKTTANVFTGNKTELYTTYDPVSNVTNKTAPCYIWHEKKDSSVNYSSSVNFSNALTEKGVKNELHIFEDSTLPAGQTTYHGIGCAQDFEQAKVWPNQSADFLKSIGF